MIVKRPAGLGKEAQRREASMPKQVVGDEVWECCEVSLGRGLHVHRILSV